MIDDIIKVTVSSHTEVDHSESEIFNSPSDKDWYLYPIARSLDSSSCALECERVGEDPGLLLLLLLWL